jgi:hypothetical protein
MAVGLDASGERTLQRHRDESVGEGLAKGNLTVFA